MSTEAPIPRWGSEAIDPEGFNIPSLKARYLLDHLQATGSVLEVGSGSGKILRTHARIASPRTAPTRLRHQ